MKIGVLGGTFDPVHLGHLKIAEEVSKSLNLSVTILVPSGQPPFKPGYLITPAEQRLQMLRLAVADRPHLRVSSMEMERPGRSYTVDTIAELRGQFGRDDEMFFVLGWDSLEQIAGWREPSRLITMCYLVAVPRPGWPPPDLESLEAGVPGILQRIVLLEKPEIDISSSAIRAMAARGVPFENLVPGPVAEYIREHKIYLTQ
jgi:nicotinate-nucleotide adenylyltransferase